MQHLINITAGNPKTVEQYQLTKDFDVVWFFSEDGKNWYEEQKYFADDTIKIAYDKDNIIRYVEKDVTAIRPDGLSCRILLLTDGRTFQGTGCLRTVQ
ncbi:phage tail fiber assembly protein [Escherichia coli]|nr:phage tail fiber assembly protein [Escherichia coli]